MVHEMFEEHDFKRYPELRDSQMTEHLIMSPHKQITENFNAVVVKVIDGDTIRLKTQFRDFEVPLRFLDIDAPEMHEEKGKEVKDWLSGKILNQSVEILINKHNRVDKYGRLLGRVIYRGMDVGNEELIKGMSKTFTNRKEGKLPNLAKMFSMKQWF